MIDRLIEKIGQTENPTVVGLDPTLAMMPAYIIEENFSEYGETPKAVAEMFFAFNRDIIDAVCDLVPAVKPQIAMYEKYGLDGLTAYIRTTAYARQKGLLVIGDIKRGDIASTAEAYAAHIDGTTIGGETFDLWYEDAVTLNPYLGTDGIEPFLKSCAEKDRGVFVLVKTSNQSSGELQDRLIDGEPLYCRTADLVGEWGRDLIGEYGYSRVGAVVGATYKEQGEALRKRLPHTFFLVPGYGAQGGTGEDLRGYFDRRGLGAIVNSSRGITAAYQNEASQKKDPEGKHFAEAAREAVLRMREDLRRASAR